MSGELVGGFFTYLGTAIGSGAAAGGAAAGGAAAGGAAGGAAAGSGIGGALAAGATSAALGAGLSAVLSSKPTISIPPPPGATMVDPAGMNAAAQTRARQAAAGGLAGTVGAGGQPNAQAAFGGVTGGGKSLLGQ